MATTTTDTRRITVHDPRGYPPKVTGKRLAPRLESLDGKVVYLVDCLFDNSGRSWTSCSSGSPRTFPRSKRGSSSRARAGSTTPTCAQDRGGGDAAILGVGL